jgi:peptidoglycan/xylan/chitin deacetylase (PgdA/CDA1 family)
MSEARWRKRLKLGMLAVAGTLMVSVPVTAAVALSLAGEDDTLVIGTGAPAPKPKAQPSEAVKAALECKATKGYYALTFDDGPYPETTKRLVAALKKAGAVATFFNIGSKAVDRRDLVELERTVGQVANHTYTHPHLPEVDQGQRLQELTATARALAYPNAWVRPPFGETDAATDADIAKTGLEPVYWTTDTYDWQLPPVETVVKRALAVQPGGIILLHDGREVTIKAIPKIVSELRERGMCPGFLAKTDKTVISSYKQIPFHVVAVAPGRKES